MSFFTMLLVAFLWTESVGYKLKTISLRVDREPPGKIMTRKDSLTKLRDVLLVRREALRKALAGDLSLLQQLNMEGGDVVDVAMETAQDEISSQLAEVESRELGHIEEALDRMKEGRYGDCEVCDKQIPLARLQAVPYATACIACARQREKVIPRFNSYSGDSAEQSAW